MATSLSGVNLKVALHLLQPVYLLSGSSSVNISMALAPDQTPRANNMSMEAGIPLAAKYQHQWTPCHRRERLLSLLESGNGLVMTTPAQVISSCMRGQLQWRREAWVTKRRASRERQIRGEYDREYGIRNERKYHDYWCDRSCGVILLSRSRPPLFSPEFCDQTKVSDYVE